MKNTDCSHTKEASRHVYMRGLVSYISRLVESKSKNEDSKRREFILNVLLVGSIIVSGVATILIVYQYVTLGTNFRGGSPLILITIFAIFVALYSLSRGGLFVVSSYILLGIYFCGATYTVYSWGVDIPTGLLVYALIIIMSGILINTRFAFFVSIIISLILIILGYLQTNSIILANVYWKKEMIDMENIIIFAVIFGIIAIISWLSNREIEKSLKRARSSEAKLKLERDSLEMKVQKRTKELERVQAEKMAHLQNFAEFGRMTSGLLHDIANPLTAISLNLEDLKRRNRDSYISENLKKALSNIGRIKNVLTASRTQIQEQGSRLSFAPSEQVMQAIQMLTFSAHKNDIQLEFTPPKDKIEIYGNPIKFYRVMSCLISNAVDSYNMEPLKLPKKCVVVFKKTPPIKKVNVDVQAKDGHLSITVQDFGCGILPENIPKIFDSLFTTKGMDSGTGLGLSIVKEFIEDDFLGTISVVSKQCEGSTFTVKIPLKNILFSNGSAQ